MQFTGKERDGETGLDYFGARYLTGPQGRWTSADILNLTNDRLLMPSTLNRYAYAANNPLRFIDQDGRDVTVMLYPPQNGFPGHIMYFAHNPTNGQSALMSFGPTDHSAGTRALQLLNAPVPGTATYEIPQSADDLRRTYASLTVQTSPEHAQAVIDLIRQQASGDITDWWRLAGPNCATVCRDALKAIGILPPDFGAISPVGLWNALFRRFSDPSKWRYESTIRYGEYFRGPLIARKPGADYGSPRYGIDTFDFIMRQLKRPKYCVTTPGLNGASPETTCE